jgi:hypothetical protein
MFLWGAFSDIVWVCVLYMLLALASRLSRVLVTRDHILLSQFWDFPFRRLLQPHSTTEPGLVM